MSFERLSRRVFRCAGRPAESGKKKRGRRRWHHKFVPRRAEKLPRLVGYSHRTRATFRFSDPPFTLPMSSGTVLRRIVVDDNDPAIQYGPNGWYLADPSKLNALGNYGPIYNGTTHATSTTGSTFTFPFNGTCPACLHSSSAHLYAQGRPSASWARSQ
jgi:hypothetical protein